MDRRVFLASACAALVAPRAFAQDLNLAQAASYSAARRGVSLLVMQRGRIIFEDYPNDGAADHGWELASGTKSFTGIMAAAAVQDGLLALDEPGAATLPEWRADKQKACITIHQLLSLNSGMAHGQILRAPTYKAAIESPMESAPGEHFAYGPAPFQAFGEILRRKLRAAKLDADPAAYLQRRVLDPIGIKPTLWRRGPDDLPLMPQGAQFTAHAWASFGQWVMEGGRGVVDRAALAENFKPSATNPGYGMSWWLLRPGLIPPGKAQPMEISAEGLARLGDVRMAAGAGDQRLYLLPERQLVIARQASFNLRTLRQSGRGFAKGAQWNDAEFLDMLLKA